MPISFACPECAKRVTAPDRMAGKRARCPGCKIVVTVPVRDVADDAGYEVVDDSPVPSQFETSAQSPESESVWQSVRGVDDPNRRRSKKTSRATGKAPPRESS